MSDWKEDKCLLLIDAYKQNQVLWNPKDTNYYKKHLKEDAWAKIGDDMNESSAVCKQKILNMLASYRREQMKVKKSTGTGKGKDEVYESKWYAYKPLSFLNDRFTTRKGLETHGLEPQENDDDNDVINVDNASSPPEPASKKSKPDPKLQMLKEAFGILKTAADKPKQDAELRTFFDFIQEKMKNYSKETKNAVQHEIFQIIMRADQGYYNYQQSYGYSPQNQQATYSSVNMAVAPSTSGVNMAVPPSTSGLNIGNNLSNSNTQTTLPPQDSPYSPYSNTSNCSSDMNIEELI